MEVAAQHAVAPQLYAYLARLGEERVPPAIQAKMDRRRRGMVMRGLQLARELTRVVRALEAAGIPAVSLKGPLLGQLAYGDLAVRQALDLDLLVGEDQFWQAKARLHQLGYRSLRTLTEAEQRAFVGWHASYELIHPVQNVVVELHHDFFPSDAPAGLTPAAAWARQQRHTLAGVDLRSLGLEDLVIYLCAHGARHEWSKLKWLCDVAGLMQRHPHIQWTTVYARAEETGTARALALAFWLIERLLGLEPPTALAPRVTSDPAVSALGAMVLERGAHDGTDPPDAPWHTFWFHLRLRERWQDRLPHLRHSLALALTPSQADRHMVALPASLSWLYYLVRPIRVLRDLVAPSANPSRGVSRDNSSSPGARPA